MKLKIEYRDKIVERWNYNSKIREYIVVKTGCRIAQIESPDYLEGISIPSFGAIRLENIGAAQANYEFNEAVVVTENYIKKFFANCGVEVEIKIAKG